MKQKGGFLGMPVWLIIVLSVLVLGGVGVGIAAAAGAFKPDLCKQFNDLFDEFAADPRNMTIMERIEDKVDALSPKEREKFLTCVVNKIKTLGWQVEWPTEQSVEQFSNNPNNNAKNAIAKFKKLIEYVKTKQ
jgi:hypothetical protein